MCVCVCVRISSCRVSVVPVRFLYNVNFLERISRDPQIPNFMKIYGVGAELLHADTATDREMDGQTDRHDEANIRFS